VRSMTSPVQDRSRRPDSDWPAEATETIESLVGLVRDRATVPLRTVARILVYGIALSVVAGVAGVLSVNAAIRALTVYLPVGRAVGGQRRVWAAYLVVGGIFTLAGLFLLRMAETTRRESK